MNGGSYVAVTNVRKTIPFFFMCFESWGYRVSRGPSYH